MEMNSPATQDTPPLFISIFRSGGDHKDFIDIVQTVSLNIFKIFRRMTVLYIV